MRHLAELIGAKGALQAVQTARGGVAKVVEMPTNVETRSTTKTVAVPILPAEAEQRAVTTPQTEYAKITITTENLPGIV